MNVTNKNEAAGRNISLINQVGSALEAVRSRRPLVHHITNYVTVNDCANIVLAVGGSPVMADDLEEVEDIVSISSALVLNIGTLNKRTIESMVAAGKQANAAGIPVILDPVGAGASRLRNETAERILKEIKIDVLRGNLSEILFTAGLDSSTKGVDASEEDLKKGREAARQVAESAARKFGCVTAVTGETDIITDGIRTIFIENGTKLLSDVTGTGCMCTSLVGAFCGAAEDMLIAATGGVAAMGIAGELAYDAVHEKGTASFHIAIIDAVSKLERRILEGRLKIVEA